MGTHVCCDLLSLPASSSAIEGQDKEDLGQTLIVVLDEHEDPSTIHSLITAHGVGSVVITCSGAPDLARIASCTRQLQQCAKDAGHQRPLTMGLKEADVSYDLLPFALGGAQFPYPLSLAAGNSTATTSRVGNAMAKILAAIGINWVFVPSLDTLTEFIEPCDASQTFGKNAESVSAHALALIQGLAGEGVSACTNAHPAGQVMEIFSTRSSTERLNDIQEQSTLPEFLPIAAAVTNYPRNSMQFGTAIHDFPEPVQSAQAIRAASEIILRTKCGFRGPTVSSFAKTPDGAAVCPKHAPLLTFQAGLDMVTLSEDATVRESSLAVLEVAIASNLLPPGLISTCAARVAAFKDQLFTWEKALAPYQADRLLLPAPSMLAQSGYRSAITTTSPGASPLLGLARSSIVVLLTPTVPRRNPDSPSDPFEPLGRALSRSFPRIRHVPYTLSAGLTDVYLPFLQRATAVVFVLCNTSSAMIESQDEFVRALHNNLRARDAMPGQQRTRRVMVGAGDPRDLRDPFTGWWGALCYEYSRGALEAVAEVLLGEREATGRLPT